MTRFPLNQQRGRRAEEDAHRYLCERGLTPVMRNFRCRVGEIDLIMRDGRHLVFVEVRYRRRSDFGDGADSVDRRKQDRLGRAALHFLQTHPAAARHPARFDVVAVAQGGRIRWIKDAFHFQPD